MFLLMYKWRLTWTEAEGSGLDSASAYGRVTYVGTPVLTCVVSV